MADASPGIAPPSIDLVSRCVPYMLCDRRRIRQSNSGGKSVGILSDLGNSVEPDRIEFDSIYSVLFAIRKTCTGAYTTNGKMWVTWYTMASRRVRIVVGSWDELSDTLLTTRGLTLGQDGVSDASFRDTIVGN